MGLLEAFDSDHRYVINHFKGEVFTTGYGLWIDYNQDPVGHKRLFEIMDRCDGGRTVADIAGELAKLNILVCRCRLPMAFSLLVITWSSIIG